MRRLACLALLALLAASAAARADKLVLVAGGDDPKSADPKKAKLIQPFGVDFYESGAMVFVEMVKGERLRAYAGGEIRTLAGAEGQKGNSGDGGPAPEARFNGPHSLAVGPENVVYVADTWNNRVRTYHAKANTVRAFAGTGEKGFAGDGGPADKAKFGAVYCVNFDPDRKNLYLTDLDNKRVRKVDMATKVVSTVAGNGHKGVPKDGGEALKQPLVDPRAQAVDRDGNLWILERSGHALRVVDKEGKIRTVAGTGKSGMGTGTALEAAMNGPKHLCIDRDGSVLIADTENHRIMRYSPKDETLTAVAGSGKKGKSLGEGDPQKAELNQPHGVAVDRKTGAIYIADSSNGRILKIVRE